jgi:hypothetical protein
MKKPRIQTALASLTPDEKQTLADWLRKGDYLDVLDRVNKPRSDGGFALNISRKPLQTFYAKVLLLDAINLRLPDDKKMTITDFESIANADRLLGSAGVSPADSGVPPESSKTVHNAIMSTACELAASSDNSPTDLALLQRIADFPARAELREHKKQLELRKEQREIEKHTHKLHLDLHGKEMTGKRLALAERSLDLREKQLELRAPSKTAARRHDQLHPGPAAHSMSEPPPTHDAAIELDPAAKLEKFLQTIQRRTQERFNLPDPAPVSPIEIDLASRSDHQLESNKLEAGLESQNDQSPFPPPGSPASTNQEPITENPVPPAVAIANRNCSIENRNCSSAPPAPRKAPDRKCQIENAHCSLLNLVRS